MENTTNQSASKQVTGDQINTTTIIVVLGTLNGLMPFSTDLYLPAFSAMASDLNIEIGLISWSLSAFFAGASIGQLINGPILDRYGRKKPMLIALGIYAVASIACAWANTIELLCFVRFLQALSISMCSVGSKATVRDVFPPNKTASVFSTMVLIMGIAPIIAPTLGSIILKYTNWQTIFFFLAIIAVALFFSLYFFLPVTEQPNRSVSLRPIKVAKNYVQVIKTPGFYGYAFVVAIASGILFSWISSSSIIFMDVLGLTEQHYGWVFAGTASCFLVGSQFNRILLRRFDPVNIAVTASFIQLFIVGGLFFVANYAFTVQNMIIGVCAFMFCLAMITPNAMAKALEPFETNAGSASASMGATQMALSAIVTSTLGVFQDGTAIPMLISMLTLVFMAFVTQLILRKRNVAQSV